MWSWFPRFRTLHMREIQFFFLETLLRAGTMSFGEKFGIVFSVFQKMSLRYFFSTALHLSYVLRNRVSRLADRKIKELIKFLNSPDSRVWLFYHVISMCEEIFHDNARDLIDKSAALTSLEKRSPRSHGSGSTTNFRRKRRRIDDRDTKIRAGLCSNLRFFLEWLPPSWALEDGALSTTTPSTGQAFRDHSGGLESWFCRRNQKRNPTRYEDSMSATVEQAKRSLERWERAAKDNSPRAPRINRG